MSNHTQSRLRRITRQRRRGQSIPIIALMIVILVAMVGLSVDVGNTFSRERQAVSASNSAALAGMSVYLRRSIDSNITPGDVYNAIERSLIANSIEVGDGAPNNLKIYYIDTEGNVIGELDKDKTSFPDDQGQSVGYLQVSVDGKVDTSFARVVGRPDLPINAQAYAGVCPINSGVYPIGIDTATITGNAFNDIGVDPSEPDEYKELPGGLFQRRIYVKDTGTPGNFSWLRWRDKDGSTGKSANSQQELAASLTGDGTISAGIEEADWPQGETVPAGYPEQPGTINPGDWIHASTGWKGGNAGSEASANAAIQQFILNETNLILPIYSRTIGNGQNAQFLVSSLGVFVITDKGKTPGKGDWFDMVYLGPPDAQQNACLVTAPPPSTSDLDLFGNVSLFPEYAITEQTQAPIQYVVVLDESGSMSANFAGECDNKSYNGKKPVQCANGGPGAPEVQVTGTGQNYWWKEKTERRIYVAKKALERLVELSNMPGNDDYTTTRPSDQMAVVWFTHQVKNSNRLNFTNNTNTIINFIENANKTGGDKYRSNGGTNGAAGLYKAKQLYDNAPKTVAFEGKDVEYKRVVLFITDGVSNQFLNTSASNLRGGQSSSNTYPKGSYCRSLGNLVVESPTCQLTDPVKSPKYKGWDRPITQMIDTSRNDLRNEDTKAEVFVIALSAIPSTGLRDGVASSSNYYFSAEALEVYQDGSTNVDAIIDTISAKVETGGCIAGPTGTSTGQMTVSEFSGSNPSGFAWPQVGQVTITKQSDVRTAPILVDNSGNLSYEFKSVPEGIYTLEAFLYYHHPNDEPGVLRLYSRIWSEGEVRDEYSVTVSSSTQGQGFGQRVDQPISLKLNGDVCPQL
jgi:hypothetical protein